MKNSDPSELHPGQRSLVETREGRSAATRSLRVLIVEDDLASSRLLRLSLEKRGHTVVAEAACGDDAQISSVNVDVAVVDLGLPGRGGGDVIRALLDHDPALAVLVLSASAYGTAVIEALLAGARGYIVKGARLADIVDAVELVAGEALPGQDASAPMGAL